MELLVNSNRGGNRGSNTIDHWSALTQKIIAIGIGIEKGLRKIGIDIQLDMAKTFGNNIDFKLF